MREIVEETGFEDVTFLGELAPREWPGSDGVPVDERVFVARVETTVEPRLEMGAATEFAWIGHGDVSLLHENLALGGGSYVHDVIREAFSSGYLPPRSRR